jgi:hypothetical protein
VRAVTMAAEGADLLGAQAAEHAGGAAVCVLPFPFEEYQRDFSPPARDIARAILERADAQFVLPGSPAEGARSYERANEIIMANIDVLVAVWNEKRANGRAGTGEMVQSAVSQRIPVILITPSDPAQPKLLAATDDDELERPIALDLARKPLDADLSRFVSQVLSPPHDEPPGRVYSTSLPKGLTTERSDLSTNFFSSCSASAEKHGPVNLTCTCTPAIQ